MSLYRVAMRSRLIRRTLVALTTLALLLSLLRLVSPLQQRIQLQTRLNNTVEMRIAQETLHPLFTELSTQAHADTSNTLMLPEKAPLHNEKVEHVATFFEELADTHGFALGRVRVLVTAGPSQRLLSVALPLDGTYEQFGPLLRDILLLASLESIDRITVQFGDSMDRFNVELKMALE